MSFINSLFMAMDALFDYLETKERRKYIDEYLELKTTLRLENEKSDSEINHAFIDHINFRMQNLIQAIRSDSGTKIEKSDSIHK